MPAWQVRAAEVLYVEVVETEMVRSCWINPSFLPQSNICLCNWNPYTRGDHTVADAHYWHISKSC